MSIRLGDGARAQIELDLDNKRESNARMSERYYLEDRYKIEGRLVFIGSLEKEIQTEAEFAILSSYKIVCENILTKRLIISKHKDEIMHYEQLNQNASERNLHQRSDYCKAMIEFSEKEISQATASINDLEQQALNLENNVVIQRLYYRAYIHAMAEGNHNMAFLMEETNAPLKRPQPEQEPASEAPEQEHRKDLKMTNPDGYYRKMLAILLPMVLSITLPLLMFNAPVWLMVIVDLILLSPMLFDSVKLAQIIPFVYYILNPIVYISALVVTIQGTQDFLAIAFYILMGIQTPRMLKNFIGTTLILYYAIVGDKEK